MVAAHLTECSACRAYAQELRGNDELLRAREPSLRPPPLRRRPRKAIGRPLLVAAATAVVTAALVLTTSAVLPPRAPAETVAIRVLGVSSSAINVAVPRDAVVALARGARSHVVIVDQRPRLTGTVRYQVAVADDAEIAVAADADRVVVLTPGGAARLQRYSASTGLLVGENALPRELVGPRLLAVSGDAEQVAIEVPGPDRHDVIVLRTSDGSTRAKATTPRCGKSTAVFASASELVLGCVGVAGLSALDVRTGALRDLGVAEPLMGVALAAGDAYAVTGSGRILRARETAAPVGLIPLDGGAIEPAAVAGAGDHVAVGTRPAAVSPGSTTHVRTFDVRHGSYLGVKALFLNTGGGLAPTASQAGIVIDADGTAYGVDDRGVLFGGGYLRVEPVRLDGERVVALAGLVDAGAALTTEGAARVAETSLDIARRDRFEVVAITTRELVALFPELAVVRDRTTSETVWAVAIEGIVAYQGEKYAWVIAVVDPKHGQLVGAIAGSSGHLPPRLEQRTK